MDALPASECYHHCEAGGLFRHSLETAVLTLSFLKKSFEHRGARSIRICTLLLKDRADRESCNCVTADYVGFTVPDEFVVGYGLDYNERYRNLPYIGVLKEEVYS